MKQYDFIIAGGGLSGLSLLLTMIENDLVSNKRILLLEKNLIGSNDRTWCFWDKNETNRFFKNLIYKGWDTVSIRQKQSENYTEKIAQSIHQLFPYRYNLIRGKDFYAFALSEIRKYPQIEIVNETVKSVKEHNNKVSVFAEQEYCANWVFSSIMPRALSHQKGKHYLLQHFKGWWITMEQPTFDEDTATIFDFSCNQKEAGNSFMYVLPLSEQSALIEYTVFSKSLLKPSDYEQGFKDYMLMKFPLKKFRIDSVEEGIIPMSNHSFPESNGRIIYLGTAGGRTKSSSGYTFQFVQKHSLQLCIALKQTGKPIIKKLQGEKRFRFYDSVFLRILSEKMLTTEDIFTRLFRRNNAAEVFKFLDNESSLKEELHLMKSLQIPVFFLAALKEIFADLQRILAQVLGNSNSKA